MKYISDYLNKNTRYVKENSNNFYSYPSFRSYIANKAIAEYTLDNIYTKEIKKAHTDGAMHIHDLSNGVAPYCCGWSLMDLLFEGFNGIEGRVAASPPKHLRSACIQMVNFIGTLQMEAAGAMAFNSVDTLLAPFVREVIEQNSYSVPSRSYVQNDNGEWENLTYDEHNEEAVYKEVKQCMQELIYGLNVPSRAGEIPFSNFSFDWTVSEDLKGQPAVIGGKPQDYTYGDCQKEVDLINKAFLEIMYDGDYAGNIFSFPIPTYSITEEFDWETENAGLLLKLTAKFGTPYFQNFINSTLKPSDIRSMCCRLSLDLRELNKSGGIFNSFDSTGSIGVVTINLPRLGLISNNESEFFDNLDKVLILAKDSLELKRKELNKNLKNGLYPYIKRWLHHGFNRHFSTIGVNGGIECLQFMDLDYDFAKKVLIHIKGRLTQFQIETGNLYNLEETPAESACHRFARKDKKYGNKTQEYYTQGFKLPYYYTDDIFEKLDMEEEILGEYTGGSVCHIFLGESVNDSKSVGKLILTALTNYRVPYFTITPTFSICQDHGYIGGECYSCPTCKADTLVYSRIVGYYSPTKRWNQGKTVEFAERKLFDNNL